MAILTPEELRESREATEAGVNDVSDTDATSAIARGEATLNACLGYKVANDAASLTLTAQTVGSLTLPQRVRSISSITDAYPGSSASTVAATDYAIRSNGFGLYRNGGWRQDNTVVITGAFGYDTTDDKYILAQQFVTLWAVRYLMNTGPGIGGMAIPPGSLVTSLTTSSGQEAAFFTPTGTSTGYQDLDTILDQIGRHPSKSGSSLYTIGLSAGTRDITFDDIIAGRETPENSL